MNKSHAKNIFKSLKEPRTITLFFMIKVRGGLCSEEIIFVHRIQRMERIILTPITIYVVAKLSGIVIRRVVKTLPTIKRVEPPSVLKFSRSY